MIVAEAIRDASDYVVTVAEAFRGASDHVVTVAEAFRGASDHVVTRAEAFRDASGHVVTVAEAIREASDHVVTVAEAFRDASDHVVTVAEAFRGAPGAGGRWRKTIPPWSLLGADATVPIWNPRPHLAQPDWLVFSRTIQSPPVIEKNFSPMKQGVIGEATGCDR